MRGIPTMHNGIKYRSLLEAKWASFFTRIGWQFEYEPFEGNGYIPDFLIHGETPLLVEVKPAGTRLDLISHIAKVRHGLQGVWDKDILIVGVSPLFLPLESGLPVAGLLGEAVTSRRIAGVDGNGQTVLSQSTETTWEFGSGLWFACHSCGGQAIRVHHTHMSFAGRPCGHYEGDHHIGWIPQREIERYWKRACNEVQWRGAA